MRAVDHHCMKGNTKGAHTDASMVLDLDTAFRQLSVKL